MAKIKVFTIWDNAVGAHGAVHAAVSRGLAVRHFIDASNDVQSDLSKHPSDFSLFELGELDCSTGEFVPNAVPTNLGSAQSFLAKSDLKLAKEA